MSTCFQSDFPHGKNGLREVSSSLLYSSVISLNNGFRNVTNLPSTLSVFEKRTFMRSSYDGFSNYFPEFHDDRNNSISFKVVVSKRMCAWLLRGVFT